MIGDGERGDPEPAGLLGQLCRTRGSVEEAVGRMAMQLGPGSTGSRPAFFLARRRALGGVTAALWLARGPPGHLAPELIPRNRRVIPAHGSPVPSFDLPLAVPHRRQPRPPVIRDQLESCTPLRLGGVPPSFGKRP